MPAQIVSRYNAIEILTLAAARRSRVPMRFVP
jgi:hypothetical protein